MGEYSVNAEINNPNTGLESNITIKVEANNTNDATVQFRNVLDQLTKNLSKTITEASRKN